MELLVGFEPTADWLQISCATIAPQKHIWCSGMGLNHWPADFQSAATTNWATQTNGGHMWCSKSHPPACKAGALPLMLMAHKNVRIYFLNWTETFSFPHCSTIELNIF